MIPAWRRDFKVFSHRHVCLTQEHPRLQNSVVALGPEPCVRVGGVECAAADIGSEAATTVLGVSPGASVKDVAATSQQPGARWAVHRLPDDAGMGVQLRVHRARSGAPAGVKPACAPGEHVPVSVSGEVFCRLLPGNARAMYSACPILEKKEPTPMQCF